VDYFCTGPCWVTPTKPGRPAAGLELIRRTPTATPARPWFAIGGITLENLGDVLSAGARRICVVSAILNAADIASACRQFKRRLAKVE